MYGGQITDLWCLLVAQGQKVRLKVQNAVWELFNGYCLTVKFLSYPDLVMFR